MAAGAIPWTAIAAWTAFYELDHEAAVLLVAVIRMLDIDLREREEAKRRDKELREGKNR